MIEVAAAFGAFVASHVAIARTGVKPWAVARLGATGYLAAYSAISVALLAWVVDALLRSPRIALWDAPVWGAPFAVAASAIAFALIGAGALIPNPLSVTLAPGARATDRPSFAGWIRHPLIWGLGLWGAAHLPSNGDWPSLLLFGGTAVFAAIGGRAVDRRAKRRLGVETWRRLADAPGGLEPRAMIGAGLGLGVWAAALAAHPRLFGADPLSLAADAMGLGAP